ncbi:MAG: HNH endonuclease [Bacteroidales bacterium]|nr:HNH endonuclease [Bacteroidales bacterium]
MTYDIATGELANINSFGEAVAYGADMILDATMITPAGSIGNAAKTMLTTRWSLKVVNSPGTKLVWNSTYNSWEIPGVEAVNTSVSGVNAAKAVPKGNVYSVAFETTLSKKLYPGVNASRHLTAANKAMLSTMDDVTMKNLNIVMKTRPNGSIIMNSSPPNWVWHHDVGTGVMQLVPNTQHTSGSIFWNTLHPGYQGGMSIWGGGY